MLDHPVQLTLALFAGLLGFGGIIGPAAQAAQYALVPALILLLLSLRADRKRRVPGARLQAWRQAR